MVRHLPNLLSFLRLLAAPFAAWLILDAHDTAALVVFAAAGLSDGMDGYIARRWGVTSDFGAWLDPAADKLLMLMCFTALYAVEAAPFWLVALVIGRDIVMVMAWLLVKAMGWAVEVRTLLVGKISTVVQVLYILVLLLLLALNLDAPRLTLALAWTCGVFTVLAAVSYAVLFLRGLLNTRRVVS